MTRGGAGLSSQVLAPRSPIRLYFILVVGKIEIASKTPTEEPRQVLHVTSSVLVRYYCRTTLSIPFLHASIACCSQSFLINVGRLNDLQSGFLRRLLRLLGSSSGY